MRKNFALALVALLALTMALAAVGCGGKKPAENAGTENTMSDQSSMPADSGGMSHDTSMAMPADTTKK